MAAATTTGSLQPMSDFDSFWVGADLNDPPFTSSSLFMFKGKSDHEYILRMIESRVATVPLYNDVFVRKFGRFYRQPVPYDAAHHVYFTSLDNGTEDELMEVASYYENIPLDRNYPLWRFVIVDNCCGGEGWAIIMNVHHSIQDGPSWSRLVTRIFDFRPGCPPELYDRTDEENLWDHGPLEWKPQPWTIANTIKLVLDTIWAAVCILLIFYVLPAQPHTSLLAKKGDTVSCWRKFRPLEEVRAVAKKNKTTISSLMMSCTSGGLAAFLKEKDGVVPAKINALLTTGLRKPTKEIFSGNAVGGLFIPLRCELDDPQERLRHCDAMMLKIKNPANAYRFLVECVITMQSRSLRFLRAFLASMFQKISIVYSSLPGNTHTLYCNDCELTTLIGCPPAINNGVSVGFATYNGKCCICMHARKGVAEDPRVIIDKIAEEFDRYL